MKKLIATGLLGLGLLLCAGKSQAAYWHDGNNAWGDFDVGGGQFCGLRILEPTHPYHADALIEQSDAHAVA